MKLFVVTALALAVCGVTADKAFRSSGDLSHVVRVGRNGRQVISSAKGFRQGRKGRKVVRRPHERNGRNLHHVHHAPALNLVPVAPAPFALPPPAAPVQFAVPHATHHAVHHAVPHAVPLAVPHAVPLAVPHATHHAVHHVVHQAPAPVPAPVPIQFTAVAQQPTLEYGAPATVAPEVQPAYLAPAQAPRDSYLAATVAPVVEAARDSYIAAAEPVVEAARDSYIAAAEPVVEAARDSYIAAAEPVVEAARDSYIAAAEPVVEAARDSYIAAAEPVVEAARVEPVVDSYIVESEPVAAVRDSYTAAVEPVAESVPVVVEAKSNYIAASPSLTSETYVPRTRANVQVTAKPKPIAIVRSHANVPAETANFDYSFETANGIKQEATGTVKNVDDVDVSVMTGSYEFVGADGVVYAVEWYADHTGFHATAPHLPQNVEPNHPEVAAAVRAQIKFAAEEDAARAASARSSSYAAPSGSYGAPSEEVATIVDTRAEEPTSQYGLPSYN